jgi:hypothetical protein
VLFSALLVGLLYKTVPREQSARLFFSSLIVIFAVLCVELLVAPAVTSRIYAEDAGVSLQNFFIYLLHPANEQTMFGWATRSIAYMEIALLFPAVSLRLINPFFLLIIPVTHSVCGMLLYPALLYWGFVDNSEQAGLKRRLLGAYSLVLLFFFSPYFKVVETAEISNEQLLLWGSSGLALLLGVILFCKYYPRLGPRNLYATSAIALTGMYIFFLTVFMLNHTELNIWQKDYFLQELSGRTLDVLRCVVIGFLIDRLYRWLESGRRLHPFLLHPSIYSIGIGFLLTYSMIISIPRMFESFEDYQHHFERSGIDGYEPYLYSLIITQPQ